VLGEGDFSYGFGVLDFSHEEVKRGFFFSFFSLFFFFSFISYIRC